MHATIVDRPLHRVTPRGSWLVAAALAALGAACAGTPRWPVAPVEHREPLVDVEHYDINVDIDHEGGYVDGIVTVHFQGIDPPLGQPADGGTRELVLDAVEMEIESVFDDEGNELTFEYDGQLLIIDLGQALPPGKQSAVTIDYDCYPRRGLFIIPPSAQEGNRPWHVWSQGQSEDTRHWIPVWDIPNDMATHELHVTVDDAFRTMAAGDQTGSSPPRDGRRTDHWLMETPHVSYLITLVAGRFAEGQLPGGNGLPLPVLAEADDLPMALENLAETADMLAIIGDYLDAPYPYSKYAQSCVKEYTAGGMENISATTLYYRTIHDPADEPQVDSLGLVAHEAAHQWFGDLLTCETWEHLWLNEGFADFFENYYIGQTRGPDRGAHQRLTSQRGYVRAELNNSRPIVWGDYEHPDDTFSGHAYAGGAARLHLLESILGERVFRRGLREYVEEHRGSVVRTDDLKHALEASGDTDLTRFFDEWLYEPGFPKFKVSIVQDQPLTLDGEPVRVLTGEVSHLTTLIVEQTQSADGWRDVFHIPVTVAWSRGGAVQRARLQLEQQTERLFLTGNGKLDWVRFDADTAVPMLLDMRQDESMWRSQLLDAEDGVTRLLAAQWFAAHSMVHFDLAAGWRPSEESIPALIQAANGDEFAPVRHAALDALIRIKDPRVISALERAALDEDPVMRERAIGGFARHGGSAVLPTIFDALEDENASVVGAALTTLVTRKSPGALTQLRNVYDRTSLARWRLDRTIVRLAGRVDDEHSLPFLMAAARTHAESRVRAAALDTLSRRSGSHDDVIHRALCEGLNDPSYRVRSAAAYALGRRGDARAELHLQARRSIEIDLSVLGAIDAALGQLSSLPAWMN